MPLLDSLCPYGDFALLLTPGLRSAAHHSVIPLGNVVSPGSWLWLSETCLLLLRCSIPLFPPRRGSVWEELEP